MTALTTGRWQHWPHQSQLAGDTAGQPHPKQLPFITILCNLIKICIPNIYKLFSGFCFLQQHNVKESNKINKKRVSGRDTFWFPLVFSAHSDTAGSRAMWAHTALLPWARTTGRGSNRWWKSGARGDCRACGDFLKVTHSVCTNPNSSRHPSPF